MHLKFFNLSRNLVQNFKEYVHFMNFYYHFVVYNFMLVCPQHARKEYLELRQEASDLQEYSNAKLDRVRRYLGVLAERAHKLGIVHILN